MLRRSEDMTAFNALLRELEAFGEDSDEAHAPRERGMLNITRDTGELLAVLVQARGARRLLEIGTSNGYSTLWLARAAAALGGSVTTVEYAPDKCELARADFARAGLGASIRALLAGAADGACDFVFLDSERSQYQAWWPRLERVLCAGGVPVVDNASSHYAEMAAFLEEVGAHAGFTSCLVPVGKGEFIAVKAGA
jgi:predicted O-methyltransferase YrrM